MLQKEYGSLYRIVSDILFQHDPMELDGKHNIGDYDAEVDAVLSCTREAEDVGGLQDLLFEVFRTDYGEGVAAKGDATAPPQRRSGRLTNATGSSIP
jgi:hypothetical protein